MPARRFTSIQLQGFASPPPRRVTPESRTEHWNTSGISAATTRGFQIGTTCTRIDSNPASLRLAVFGDSFTAGQFLKINWPDLAEDLTRPTSQPLELLNFSVDGGGLANWWSVLTRMVQPQKYQLDGVVFAVFYGDLRRGFSITEYQGYTHPMFARVPSWNPQAFPLTPEQAQRYYEPAEPTIVGRKEFDAFLAGTWRPISARSVRGAPALANGSGPGIPKD